MPAAPQPVDLSGFHDDEDAFEQAKAVAQPVIELLRLYNFCDSRGGAQFRSTPLDDRRAFRVDFDTNCVQNTCHA